MGNVLKRIPYDLSKVRDPKLFDLAQQVADTRGIATRREFAIREPGFFSELQKRGLGIPVAEGPRN
jgi:hypothetical protein